AHAIARRSARRLVGVVAEQADHHADRLLVLDADAADGVERVEEAGVLDQDQRALVGVGQARRDADALVLLADADQAKILVAGDRRQQARRGDDIGQRQHVLDAARLECGDDAVAMKLAYGAIRARHWGVHIHPPDRRPALKLPWMPNWSMAGVMPTSGARRRCDRSNR